MGAQTFSNKPDTKEICKSVKQGSSNSKHYFKIKMIITVTLK